MDLLLPALTRPVLAAAKLVDEMISASLIESAARACAEIDRKNVLRRVLAEIEPPRLTSSGAA